MERDSSYYQRREALNKMRAILAQPDEVFDNPRAGYWTYLTNLRDGLQTLEWNQEESRADDTEEIIEHNEKARDKYRQEVI